MAKRTIYPLYGENRPRKALRNLMFKEIPVNTGDNGSARSEGRESAVRRNLLEAMRSFYNGTRKEWMIKYWHDALQPTLLASLDEVQRRDVIAEFERSVKEECQANHTEFVDSQAWRASKDAIMPFTSTILLYAKNFEVRTKQRLQSVMLLDSYFKQENNGLSLLEAAKSAFGKIMFDESASLTIAAELTHALVGNTKGLPTVSIEVYTRICLLTKTFQSFLDQNYTPWLYPVALTLDVLARSMRENLKLHTELLHDTLRTSLCAVPAHNRGAFLSLDLIRDHPAALDYVAANVVPIFGDWLSRASQWKQYSTSIVALMREMIGPSIGSHLKGFSSNVIAEVIETSPVEFAQHLSIHTIFRFATLGLSSRERGQPPERIVPASATVCSLLADDLTCRVFGINGQRSTFQRGVWMESISQICSELLVVESADTLRKLLKGKVAESVSGNVYKEIHQALSGLEGTEGVMGALDALEAKELVALDTGKTASDWDDAQIRGLQEDVATSLLPSRIGGRNVAANKERSILTDLATRTGSSLSLLLDVMVREAAGFPATGPLLLEFGNWFCSDDPSIAPKIPPELNGYVDKQHLALLKQQRPGFEYLWHAGWSTVNCDLSGHKFQCTVTQLRIIEKLLAAKTPLRIEDVIPHALDESDQTLMQDLVEASNGFVKSAVLPSGDSAYALDLSVAPPSLVRLRFVEEI